MGKRAIRDGKRAAEEAMDVGDGSGYQYASTAASVAASSVPPKKAKGRKSLLKLSRKQKIRKEKKKERAEGISDRASAKGVRDIKKLNRRISAKTLW